MSRASSRQLSLTRTCLAITVAVAASAVIAKPALATTDTWLDTDGLFWSNTAGWVSGVLPAANDDVFIGTHSTASSNPTLNFTSNLTNTVLHNMTINSNGTGLTGTMTFSQTLSSSVMAAVNEVVGDTISGNLYTQNGGTNSATQITVGSQIGGSGSYNLSGGSVNVGTFIVGNSGTGSVSQSAGNVTISSIMVIGQINTFSSSSYTLSGGNLTVNNGAYFVVGGAKGSMNQTGGTVNFLGPNGFYVGTGNIAGNTNTYTLSGTGQITNVNFEDIGQSALGTAVFQQNGGTNTFASGGQIMLGDGGAGVYNLTNGTLSSSSVFVGYASGGSGVFNQSGGAHNVISLHIGNANTTSGTYNLSGGNLTIGYNLTPGYLNVGDGGSSGLFNQTGGNVTLLNIGGAGIIVGANSNGTYALHGGTLAFTGTSGVGVTIGYGATGAFAQTGGTVNITNGYVTVGAYSDGNYTLSNTDGVASFSVTNVYVGSGSANGTFNQSNGTAAMGSLYIGGASSAHYNLSGGNLTVTSFLLGNGSSGTYYQTGGNATISGGNITGTGFLSMTGTANLTLPGGSGSFTDRAGGSVEQLNGAVNGYLTNAGSYYYSSGTFNGTLENALTGNIPLDPGTTITPNNLLNKGTISPGPGVAIGAAGGGVFDNENTLALNGGSTTGGGVIVNNGILSGFGTLGGSGGFTNNGYFSPANGTLVFAVSGINTNPGTIALQAGRQFQFSGGVTLNNTGSFLLNNAIVNGTGTLNNNPSGTITGPGLITSALVNTGAVNPGSGTLDITNGWTNGGTINLSGPGSSLTGGTVTNGGAIQGAGSVAAGINNTTGSIEAIGGVLSITGALTNAAGGAIYASSGNKVLVNSGLATNSGLISLTGGTFDNNNLPLLNNGTVTGYGSFRASTLTNNATMVFTGGTATVNANLVNNAGKTVNFKYQPGIVTGNVTNNGTIKTTGTTVTFLGTYTGNVFVSDPSTNIFQADVNTTGSMTGSTGDVFIFMTGNVTNSGTFNNGGTLQSSDNVTNTGTFTQTGPQSWSNGTVFTNNAPGVATFGTDAGSGSASPLSIVANGGTVSLSASQHLNAITVTTGTAAITTGTTKTNALTLGGSTSAWTGNLSLGSNKLIVEAAVNKGAVLNTLQNQANYGTTHATGITSAALPAHTALAVIDNGALLAPFTVFGGISVDTNSILLAPELLGDANIDGHVDLTDLSTVLNNFGAANAGWTSGNFDGAPTIDLTDLSAVLNNFGVTYANSSAETVSATSGGSIGTPEPGSLALLACAAGMVVRRRVRRA